MKLGFLSKIFEGALSIEKTYNQCDAALSELKATTKNAKRRIFVSQMRTKRN